MSSSGVGPEKDPLERYYRVEKIERVRWEEDKEKNEEFFLTPSEKNEGGFAVFLLLLLEKIKNFINVLIHKGLLSAHIEPIHQDLSAMKGILEIMMKEDRSQDIPFLKSLSKLWRNILEHSLHLKSKKNLDHTLKTLIFDLANQPENREHTFGYYLDQFAGETWLPFPYIELLQELHRKHLLDPSSSLLTRWTGMIGQILNSE